MYKKKEKCNLIPISKEESEKIRSQFPTACIPRTMKGKSQRHRYYCSTERKYMQLIADTNILAKEWIQENSWNNYKK